MKQDFFTTIRHCDCDTLYLPRGGRGGGWFYLQERGGSQVMLMF